MYSDICYEDHLKLTEMTFSITKNAQNYERIIYSAV